MILFRVAVGELVYPLITVRRSQTYFALYGNGICYRPTYFCRRICCNEITLLRSVYYLICMRSRSALWATPTVSKTVRPMLSDRCLSCLSVLSLTLV